MGKEDLLAVGQKGGVASSFGPPHGTVLPSIRPGSPGPSRSPSDVPRGTGLLLPETGAQADRNLDLREHVVLGPPRVRLRSDEKDLPGSYNFV